MCRSDAKNKPMATGNALTIVFWFLKRRKKEKKYARARSVAAWIGAEMEVFAPKTIVGEGNDEH